MPRLDLPDNTLLCITGPRRVSFSYMNYKGKISRRRAVLIGIYWGSNKWHSKPQWLVKGEDLDKGAIRTYALKDIRDVRPLGDDDE
jgi:hypothetical protein